MVSQPSRRTRKDAHPDGIRYRDEGCEMSPSCLRCPLERCILDEPADARQRSRAARDASLSRRRAAGTQVHALASEFGLSPRSVYRVLAEGREQT
jgi:hypothetical protein